MERSLITKKIVTKRGVVPANTTYIKELKRVQTQKIGARKANDLCSQSPGQCINALMKHGQPTRKHMPQINTRKALRQADAILPAQRSFKKVKAANLKFSQREINLDTVRSIRDKMKRSLRRSSLRRVKPGKVPIVVFEHPKHRFTVGDGHHRVAAVQQLITEKVLPKDTRIEARVYAMNPELGLLTLNSTGFYGGASF